jgi:tRNA pseudouridine38-40 synthase
VLNASVMSPFWRLYAIHEPRSLDLAAMSRCANSFIGEHDWTAFSAAQADTETRVRTLTQVDVTRRGDESGLIEFTVSADGFLRYMVRSIVGTLLAVGQTEINEDTVARAISGGDRSLAGPTAPAHGLTLLSVKY